MKNSSLPLVSSMDYLVTAGERRDVYLRAFVTLFIIASVGLVPATTASLAGAETAIVLLLAKSGALLSALALVSIAFSFSYNAVREGMRGTPWEKDVWTEPSFTAFVLSTLFIKGLAGLVAYALCTSIPLTLWTQTLGGDMLRHVIGILPFAPFIAIPALIATNQPLNGKATVQAGIDILPSVLLVILFQGAVAALTIALVSSAGFPGAAGPWIYGPLETLVIGTITAVYTDAASLPANASLLAIIATFGKAHFTMGVAGAAGILAGPVLAAGLIGRALRSSYRHRLLVEQRTTAILGDTDRVTVMQTARPVQNKPRTEPPKPRHPRRRRRV